MAATYRLLASSALVGFFAVSSGCVIHERDGAAREEGYREGYYDRDHNRYWREHTWHECREHDEYCR